MPLAPLEGRWVLIRAELDGQPAPDTLLLRTVVTLAAGHYTVQFDGEVADHGRFERSGTHPTSQLALHGQTGPNAGRTLPCLYQHVGDRLRICYGLNGVLPTDFTTAPGQSRYLATYRRGHPADRLDASAQPSS